MVKDKTITLKELIPDDYDHYLEQLRKCRICPRKCGADRFSGKLGYCKSDTSFYISSICIHRGEEPSISGPKGICNVFFGHCNLQCAYCQNHQISDNSNPRAAKNRKLQDVLAEIIRCLDAGCKGLGFVSPTHFVPQMKIIIHALHDLGYYPAIIYNTNGYDTVETLQDIEHLVDVYLPDAKYLDETLSRKYSDASDYPGVLKAALKEMYRQKGSSLFTDHDEVAERGIIIRHLILPGYIDNSLEVLRFIANEISTSLSISLMSQYHPTFQVIDLPPLNRNLFREEYFKVIDEFHKLGFRKGFIQDLESSENYRPDFEKDHPFEH
ncbi:MAG: radical SAM protein [Bacteroidales bacterium]|nr:radical SAM protein [Bacteroidales bacterium]